MKIEFDDENLMIDDKYKFRIGELSLMIIEPEFGTILSLIEDVTLCVTLIANEYTEYVESTEKFVYSDAIVKISGALDLLYRKVKKLERYLVKSNYYKFYENVLSIVSDVQYLLTINPKYEKLYSRIPFYKTVLLIDEGRNIDKFTANKLNNSTSDLEKIYHDMITILEGLKSVILFSYGLGKHDNIDKKGAIERASLIFNKFKYPDLSATTPGIDDILASIEEVITTKESWAEIKMKLNITVTFEFNNLDNSRIQPNYNCLSIIDIIYIDFFKTLESKKSIKVCENCGNYFITENRKDEKYCNRLIGRGEKTCKDVGATNTYKKTISKESYLLEKSKFHSQIYASTVRPYKSSKIEHEKALLKFQALMGIAESMIGDIERANGVQKQHLIDDLFQWFNDKRNELMPRRKAI